MSTEPAVILSVEGPIATVTLNRAKQLNALNRQLLTELNQCIQQLEETSEVRAVILRGDGKAFAAGADIKEMQELDATGAESFSSLGQRTFLRLEHLHCPTIALVHGYALGGGMELSMACDIRIAAAGTRFGQPEVNLGLIPGFGGTQRLPRIVGQGRALAMMLSGEPVRAEDALAMGLVTQVVDREALDETGRKLAEKLAGLAPRALQFVKRAVYEGAEMPLNHGLAMEAAWFGLCFQTKDKEEGISAFLEKRTPEFHGS